jgi:hypothetical protein
MSKRTKHLSQATRQHLFKLITDPVYRRAADSSSYDYVPTGDGQNGRRKGGGESLRKFGYTASLASGSASRGNGPDPGRYRLAEFKNTVRAPGERRGVQRTTWWVATHVPGNMYKFDRILFPKCDTCKGKADVICASCDGTGRVQYPGEHRAGPCTSWSTAGLSECSSCKPPLVVDGKALSQKLSEWG